MKARTRTAGRTTVGLALAATTVAAMAVPAAGAPSPATAGATALALPPLAPTALPQATATMSHRVQAGDTVSAIAARTGTTVSAIVRANGLDSRALIKVGQLLRIPAPGTSTSTSSSSSTSNGTAARSHTVVAGDTVSALAKRYGSSVSAIVRANDLDSRAFIVIGQRLTVPGSGGSSSSGSSSSGGSNGSSSSSGSSSSAARSHTVVAGDTVSVLAKRYGSSVSAIVRANDLGSNAMIRIGQRLTIPAGGSVSSSSSSSSGSSSSGSSSSSSAARSHTVVAGDTVSALAQRYGSSVSAISSANRLGSGAVIFVGQKLTIPGAGSGSSSGGAQLVGNTFLGRTYADSVVSAANANKATLNSMSVPSRDQMRQIVRETALQMGVDPSLAMAVAHQESGFDARAVSPANAVGVMQVIPSSGTWASELVGRQLNLLDPRDNVVAGVAILRQLRRTASSLDIAIAGYYQGLAGVNRNGMYPDTRNYVAGIRNLMQRY